MFIKILSSIQDRRLQRFAPPLRPGANLRRNGDEDSRKKNCHRFRAEENVLGWGSVGDLETNDLEAIQALLELVWTPRISLLGLLTAARVDDRHQTGT